MRADSPPVRSLAGRLQAVELRHADVHQHEVRLGPPHLLDRVEAVACLGDDLDLGQRSQEPLQERTKSVRVVDDDDALRVRSCAGHAVRLAAGGRCWAIGDLP